MLLTIETDAYESDFNGDPTETKYQLSFNPTMIALMEDASFIGHQKQTIQCCRMHLQGIAKPIHLVMVRKDMSKFLSEFWNHVQQQQQQRIQVPVPILRP